MSRSRKTLHVLVRTLSCTLSEMGAFEQERQDLTLFYCSGSCTENRLEEQGRSRKTSLRTVGQ